jgi:Polyketide cyclase / dehydrase and lipid transport
LIRIELTLEIARPPSGVFAYISDPARLSEWQGTAEVEQLTPGPVREGTRFREAHERMGRRIESVTEVTGYDPDTYFAVDIVEGPVPIDGQWNLEPSAAGTEINFAATGKLSGRMRLLEPLIARAVRRQMRRDHARLKQVLESRS